MMTLLIGNRSAALLVAIAAGLVTTTTVRAEDEDDARVAELKARGERVNWEAQRQSLDERIDALQSHIHHLRRQHLDLQAAIDQMGVRGDKDEERARSLQAELMQIEYEVQRRQLDLERTLTERENLAEQREMMRMTDRLEYVAGWRDVAFDPPRAVVMATQAVVELKMAAGDAEGAAGRLEELLKRIDDRGSRTALRFALKDVYLQLGRNDEAVRHMLKVIEENSGVSGALR